eukprot:13413229-Alexandrium_andersonii.AAC.1
MADQLPGADWRLQIGGADCAPGPGARPRVLSRGQPLAASQAESAPKWRLAWGSEPTRPAAGG